MLRWTDDQLREYHGKRQGRADAHAEARQHQKEVKRPKYNNRIERTAFGRALMRGVKPGTRQSPQDSIPPVRSVQPPRR